jgi:hypothetical protein
MMKEHVLVDQIGEARPPRDSHPWFTSIHVATRALVIFAFCLLVYGLVWNYATRRYLKGFSDAIVPLQGTAEQRTEGLLAWFRHEPPRLNTGVQGEVSLRNPVVIVQNEHLLKICGSASNAFINLADAAGLKTRRLLLRDKADAVIHVVVEVRWGDRWVVVDPQLGLVFRDRPGRPLTKEELRKPAVFAEAISAMPGYNPQYNFANTIHVRMRRMPFGGLLLRRILTRLFPGWEEAVNWGYFPENPSLWPVLFAIPLLFASLLLHGLVGWYGRKKLSIQTRGMRERLWQAGRVLLRRAV